MKEILVILCLIGGYCWSFGQGTPKDEGELNVQLVNQLSTIYTEDQKYRGMVGDIEKKYGMQSKEMAALWKTIQRKDSANHIQVSKILDEYGWLGPSVVGQQGNTTLFLVIQHADLETQEKYLPMMRDAVSRGHATGGQLAFLEDRVALRRGKKQLYGSQIHRDNHTGEYRLAPIEDEPNVNKRRASVGLGPIEEYVKRWGIEYKVSEH